MSDLTRKDCRSPLLMLPNELLQSIYLHCLEPNMAFACGSLGAVLSAETLLQATLLQAFWNPDPLHFIHVNVQPVVATPRYWLLSQSANLRVQSRDDRVRMQQLVLSQPWCTFRSLRRCFTQLIAAISRDLIEDLNLLFSPDHQLALDTLVDHPPRERTTFAATSLDGPSITLDYSSPLAHCARLTYTGPDPRFNYRSIPNLAIQPTLVMILPNCCLEGDTWTDCEIQRLRMLCYGVNLKEVGYSDAAFHAGIKNAVLRRNPTALLILAWAADRLSQARMKGPHESPFTLPAELFQLAVSNHRSEDEDSVDAIAISMFKILLRTHAESMPKSDNSIIAWATQLTSKPYSQAFGQWLINFSNRPEENEYLLDCGGGGRWFHEEQMVRQPFFRGGEISYKRSDDEIMQDFMRIEGNEPESFDREVAKVVIEFLDD